jgi:uncharacterized protein (TIGR00725 family)
MGSAGGFLSPRVLAKAAELGDQIAGHNCVVLTGACPGLPHEAAVAARRAGALVIGVSPALSLAEHVERYNSPYEEYDCIIYTGSGLMGREVATIRSCDIVLIIGGRSGTLGEFAIAFDEGKLIAVLEGTGGIADHIRDVVAMIDKDTNADIVYDENPGRLLDKAIALHEVRIAECRAYHAPPPDG